MTTVASIVEDLLGTDVPIAVEAYDGSRTGPPADRAPALLRIRSADALRRIATAPGELGLARAYVAGDLDLEGDVFAALDLRDRLPTVKIGPAQLAEVVRLLGVGQLRPLPPPAEEVRLRGRLHSPERDARAISHHYDVSNDFYQLVLGPSLTYSCAVFGSADDRLEDAQARKHELVAGKLGLGPGKRFLDVGCGWGSMVIHAAQHHGVQAVGVTVSEQQAARARERVAEAGLTDRVEIRLQDYRDISDGPYDAISSIGMFEHVGLSQLEVYFDRLRALLRPEGRLLNHGIARPPWPRRRIGLHRNNGLGRHSFVQRYVFPDGELHEVGSVVTTMQEAGFEVRHVEGLREHYALTLRHWVANLEQHWDEAVALTSPGRARVWRLYLAASARNFEAGRSQIFQVLATRSDHGRAGMALRPEWDALIVEPPGLLTSASSS
jgi:cyclopropane-fatty-acyl-phospholipid synthase